MGATINQQQQKRHRRTGTSQSHRGRGFKLIILSKHKKVQPARLMKCDPFGTRKISALDLHRQKTDCILTYLLGEAM